MNVQEEAERNLRAWIHEQSEAAEQRQREQRQGDCPMCLDAAARAPALGLQPWTCPDTCPNRGMAIMPPVPEPPGRLEAIRLCARR